MLPRYPLLVLLLTALAGLASAADLAIVTAQEAGDLERLAAREVRRYVYLRTGLLGELLGGGGTRVIVGRKDREVVHAAAAREPGLAAAVAALEPQQYRLKRLAADPEVLLIAGGDDAGVLYGAYRFTELLGVRFYLEGDVVPDQRIAFALPAVDETGRPLFATRGIQPFHDFPEGPDWWNLDDYKAILGQLPKLRMNFVGFHCYPRPEPLVWIGRPEDAGAGRRPSRSYEAAHFTTVGGGWGFDSLPTSRYAFGADLLFDRDDYGADYMTPAPGDVDVANSRFERVGDLLHDSFTFARRLGIRTCVGTETPLRPPAEVVQRLAETTRAERTWRPVGGKLAAYHEPIANTESDEIYQTVRWSLDAYEFGVPNGSYKVTLQFSEVAYDQPGRRVFGVAIQDQLVIPRLDIIEQVGKNAALDFEFDDIRVADGKLVIGFRRQVEHPCIAGIQIAGPDYHLKVNCSGGAVGDYVADEGVAQLDPEAATRLYEGIFRRIAQTHPLDYYWLWTPEDWTWRGATEQQVAATVADLRAAMAAAERVGAPFSLATCGWVLGPPSDRALFDRVLTPGVPMACISRQVGWDRLEPGFAAVNGRPTWAIPWLEDDPGMTIPQLWVGRLRRDAADALAYGCSGLLGIHWRTRVLGPNVAALAAAGWEQRGWNPTPGKALEAPDRDLPAADFYRDWAAASFGGPGAEQIGAIFTRLDSGGPADGVAKHARLPRPATWIAGPGGIKPDARDWVVVQGEYAFVAELEALRPAVTGAGNLERFDFWLNQFRYLRALGRHNCLWARLGAALQEAREQAAPEAQRTAATARALSLWQEMVAAMAEAQCGLMATVSTPGGLGNVANWQQHNLFRRRGSNASLAQVTLLAESEAELAALLGGALPADAQWPRRYSGPPRLIVPTVRGSLERGEDFRVRVVALGFEPASCRLRWRQLGRGEYRERVIAHVARGVYEGVVRADELADDFEYAIEATDAQGARLVWPPTAPQMNQTVVIMPAP